jgi:predicted transporter
MLTKLLLAAMAGLVLQAKAVKQPPTAPPQKLNAILCQTEAQAIALVSRVADGKTETIAVNLVNKAAVAEVYGRYIGYAVVETEKTANHLGSLFMLAGLRFAEDGRLAWTVSWVAPFQGATLERGT